MMNPRIQTDTRILKSDYALIQREATKRNITVSFLLTLILKYGLKHFAVKTGTKTVTRQSMKILCHKGADLKRVCFTLPESIKYQLKENAKLSGYNYSLSIHLLIVDVIKSGNLQNV